MNVILVTVDAWRASHASFQPSADADYTPNLGALAENGVAFEQAVSHGPATPYAFPALFTSTLPLDYGGYERVSEERLLVSEALAGAGWRCTGVHANPWLGEKYGYGRGYDAYHDVGEFGLPLFDRVRETLIRRFGLDHPVYRAAQSAYRRVQAPLRSVASGSDEVTVARSALASADGDAFVWMHLLAPHAPYAPPERHRRAVGVPDVESSATDLVTRAQRDPSALSERERDAVRGLYAASVRHADEQVGDLLESVDDDALVVVTADHGEALFEHGQVGHDPALYDELVHVPLLIRPPADRPAAADAVAAQVRHVDVAPTILDYAGVSPPDTFTGASLRPAVEGEPVEERLAVSEVASTATTPGTVDGSALQVGVRTPSRKLVYADDAVLGFDLRADPGENHPIGDPAGRPWRRLRSTLEGRLQDVDVGASLSAARDRAVEQRLRDLGYFE